MSRKTTKNIYIYINYILYSSIHYILLYILYIVVHTIYYMLLADSKLLIKRGSKLIIVLFKIFHEERISEGLCVGDTMAN